MPVDYVDPASLVARDNPRKSMDDEKYEELKASIKANGVLEPIRYRKVGEELVVESGHRRHKVAVELGLPQVPVIAVEGDDTAHKVNAVVTNVVREDMNPVDEAEAYATLAIGHGLTPSGIAERVGVTVRRVNERLDLLELPAEIVELFRSGELTPGCRGSLRTIAKKDAALAVWIAKVCAGKPDHLGVLSTEPERVLIHAAQERKHTYAVPGKVEHKGLKLKKSLLDRIEAIEKDSHYSWWMRIESEDVDAARAAGVLIECGEGRGIITDVEWLREQAAVIIERDERELARRKQAAAKAKATELIDKGGVHVTQEDAELAASVKEFRSNHRAALLQGRVAARAANLELGRALMDKLASVDVGGMSADQARTIAYAMVGPTRGELFMGGLRYCLEEFQSESVEKQKNGKEKRTVTYVETLGDASQKFDAWFARAKKPGEIVGRALIAYGAAKYADQGCVPQSGRKTSGLPRMHIAYAQSEMKAGPLPFDKALEAALKDVVPKELRGSVKPSEKPVNALFKKTDQATLRAAGFTIAAGGA